MKNVYKHLQFLFEALDGFKAEMLEYKDDKNRVASCEYLIDYYTDVINNTLVEKI